MWAPFKPSNLFTLVKHGRAMLRTKGEKRERRVSDRTPNIYSKTNNGGYCWKCSLRRTSIIMTHPTRASFFTINRQGNWDFINGPPKWADIADHQTTIDHIPNIKYMQANTEWKKHSENLQKSDAYILNTFQLDERYVNVCNFIQVSFLHTSVVA